MSNSLNLLTDAILLRTEEINALNRKSNDLSKNKQNGHRSKFKKVINRSSEDMDAFETGIKGDVVLYRRYQEKVISILSRATKIHLEDFHNDQEKLELVGSLEYLVDSMKSMSGSTKSLRDSVIGLPRLTTKLNHSKKRTREVLGEIIFIADSGIVSLEKLLSNMPGR